MRLERCGDRAAWTAHVEGSVVVRENKYGNERTGKYPSKKQADDAAKLFALAACGKIRNLREEVNFVLVEGQGKIRLIAYRADFVFDDLDGVTHICDSKGFKKDKIYRLKKKLMLLLHGLEIEEL